MASEARRRAPAQIAMAGRSAVAAGGWKPLDDLLDAARRRGTDRWEIADYGRFVSDAIRLAVERREPACYANKQAYGAALAHLFAGATLQQVIGWSERFHHLLLQLPQDEAGRSTVPIGPELLAHATFVESRWTVRQLRDRASLAAEGEAMQHCVALYDTRVAAGACAIFSLQSPSGDERVTVEVARANVSGWCVVQARGHANAPVAQRSNMQKAVDDLVATLEAAVPDTALPKSPHNAAAGYRDNRGRDRIALGFYAAYGERFWSMLRGVLPGAAHGSIPDKLVRVFLGANPQLRRHFREDAEARTGN